MGKEGKEGSLVSFSSKYPRGTATCAREPKREPAQWLTFPCGNRSLAFKENRPLYERFTSRVGGGGGGGGEGIYILFQKKEGRFIKRRRIKGILYLLIVKGFPSYKSL